MADAPKKVPFVAATIQRATSALNGMVNGGLIGWFGPGNAVASAAPGQDTERQFDYQTGINQFYTPRGESTGVSFETLRGLADPALGGYDMMRLAIETRKDQMSAQKWCLRSLDGKTDGGTKARTIEKLLRKPDMVHTWLQWQRALMEDLLVIDAPTIYLAPSVGPFRIPQYMDGATIKPLIQMDGRTPLPPSMAYQQVLKGVPGDSFDLNELIYMPRNVRSNRIYGMPPVEQVIMTVSIALRRQLSQMEYYTAGSVPDVVFGTPDTWDLKAVKLFQAYWDNLLSGNTAERRRARFVPGALKPLELKPGALKDEFDEWLARIICFCFSLSPQAFVKQMNRATAETAQQAALEEGLEPLKLWWKDVMDAVLVQCFDADDLEYAYADEEISDPAIKATVYSLATGKKAWIDANEARAAYGLSPKTPEELDAMNPAPPPPAPPGADKPPAGQDDPAKRAKRSLHRSRATVDY